MTKSLDEVRKSIKPEVQAAARTKAEEVLSAISLAETRKARGQNHGKVRSRAAIR